MHEPLMMTLLCCEWPSQTPPSLTDCCCARRFLRARRFDPVKAQKQFADAEAWRAKHSVDEMFATFPVEEFEDSKRFYPRWTGRRDKVSLVSSLLFEYIDVSSTGFRSMFTG